MEATPHSQMHSFKTQRLEVIKNIQEVWPNFKVKIDKFKQADKDKMENDLKNGFKDIRKTWLAGEHPDVKEHWPPRVIIGKQVGEAKELMKKEDDNLEVRLM